ncbi:MAG TPA: alkaline phosphatase family protein [Candidatus Binataceae bacterium]|nr:alkaline phosphatase family protein [Candidatus Binataceae bacterium]
MRIVRKKWKRRTAALALGSMLIGQIGVPLAQAQNYSGPSLDARFRGNLNSLTGALSGGTENGSASAEIAKAESVAAEQLRTKTPIKHVILIIGENRTFDHVFATYTPPSGQTVNNLLSEGIVTADGSQGANFTKGQQFSASDTTTYSNSPGGKAAYTDLPPMGTDGAPADPYVSSLAEAQAVESLALESTDLGLLLTGGTGLPGGVIDTRFPTAPPNGPVDMHNSIPYDSYAASPVHRFFQMWQQTDCNISYATSANPSGCLSDLFPWVEVTIGAGSNGAPPPSPFTDISTGEGSASMQYQSVAQGDVPYFVSLAQQYALSDNFHQSVMGGTGTNHIELGFGYPIFYANRFGLPATPPSGQIENPNPQSGTNNYYIEDGYGGDPGTAEQDNGGSYVNCADSSQPGVAPILDYLSSLPYKPNPRCIKTAYYLVNNYNPGYLGDGTPAPLGADQFTVPPTMENNIGLLLSYHGVSWKYYGEGWDGGTEDGPDGQGLFCNICDPFLYSTQIMTNPILRANNQDLGNLYDDISNTSLPAVSIVKPDGLLDGHPASSKFDLFEAFCKKIIDAVNANPTYAKNTAIMITVDEGGGYYDSGYIQPLDFFGDGTRIPFIVVSPYSAGGRVVHTYYDHVSFDKFVEANWLIHQTISQISRDNLPNPIASASNPYVPANAPAIGDLMDMFVFPSGKSKSK